MESVTKSRLSEEQIIKLARKAFGDHAGVKEIIELKDGYFNAAFMVELESGFKTVLKVAPDKNTRVMRYEADLMKAEVFTINKISGLKNVPVPKVLFYDESRETIPNEYFFMDFIEGVPLNKIRNDLNSFQQEKIDKQLGEYVKQINSIKGDYYGYITRQEGRADNWSSAFLYMIKELLDDAAEEQVKLPLAYDELYKTIEEKKSLLDEVKVSTLVHKDLWAGNIFINPDTAEITGLVDCERAVYADPLLEPVCGFLTNNSNFMKVYLDNKDLTENEQQRIRLYYIYLFLLMIIECPFRKYPDPNIDKWPREQLDILLKGI